MLEFDEVAYYDRTSSAWAARGATGIYMIISSLPARNYVVWFKAYGAKSATVSKAPYGFLRHAIKAANNHYRCVS